MFVAPRLRLLLLAALLQAAPAAAAPITFAIDPVQSNISLSGNVTVDFGLPAGPIVIPLTSQVGIPGVSGDVLPSGVLSDGLTTSVSGQIDGEIDLGAGTFEALGGPVTPGISGTWLQGWPVLATPTSAQAGLAFSGSGFSGTAALREVALAFTTTVLSLTPIGGGAYEFDAGSTGVWSLTAGFLDQATSLGTPGRIALNLDFGVVDLSGVTLTPDGSGGFDVTLPADLAIALDADDWGIAFPVFVDIQVSGSVAANGTIIPEPSTAALLLLGFAVLATRRSRVA